MNISGTMRLAFATSLLLSLGAIAATPQEDQGSSPPASTVAQPVVPPGVDQHAPPAPHANQTPPAIAAVSDATPKEQAAVAAAVPTPGGASGFRLMTLSTNALLSRVSLADQAEHTIDLQYFIFNNDATGRLIALHLLQAADRGVHVRILLDDMNLKDEASMFNALASNPNIEVKLFNPFHTEEPGPISKVAQMLLEFRRLNRRMHNKCFIVDNQVAIVGGRNIGDAYFDAKVDNNFRDLDLLAIGPVVPAATRSFENYWNSDAAHSIKEFRPGNSPAVDLGAVRAELEKDARTFDQSAYKQAAQDELPNGASADRPGNWFWGPATLVADQPEKIDAGPERTDLRISPELKDLIRNAQSEVLLISPYFVPSDRDEQNFVADAQRGVAFKVLTNSLASTDEVPVHEGYASHRRALLAGGVQLFELKQAPGVSMSATDVGQSSGVSLHAKSIVVDRRYVFIGSLNLDQRSKLLNTEMGIVVDSPQLAKAVVQFFDAATLPANAYHVILGSADGKDTKGLHWETTKDGAPAEYDHDPDAPLHRRTEVQLIKLLPIDDLL